MKDKFKKLYMDIAEVTAKMSVDKRSKVGAVAVFDHRILSIGYNGTPSGWDNTCQDENNVTKPEVIHAEQNLIYKMARDGQQAKGASLFVTLSPCVECAKAIYSSGFTEIIYRDDYRKRDGLDFLEKCGVKVQKLLDNETEF